MEVEASRQQHLDLCWEGAGSSGERCFAWHHVSEPVLCSGRLAKLCLLMAHAIDADASDQARAQSRPPLASRSDVPRLPSECRCRTHAHLADDLLSLSLQVVRGSSVTSLEGLEAINMR